MRQSRLSGAAQVGCGKRRHNNGSFRPAGTPSMTKGVIVQLKDVVYMSEQALRWTPEADGKGRFISGVTLYWEQSDLPVIKSHIVDLDDPEYNLEANILEQVLE